MGILPKCRDRKKRPDRPLAQQVGQVWNPNRGKLTMNFTEFLANLDAALQPSLASAGFRRTSAGMWNRRGGQEINVVWIQKHSANLSCCVNLGVHYAFLPKAGTEGAITGDELEQADCEIKLRLTSDASKKDQWWPLSEQATNEVCQLITERALALFESYKLDAGISELDAKEIERGTPGLLAPLTKVRACLLLARLHEHSGNRGKCVEAATLGLRLAGMAVGPKKILKDILKRCELPA